MIKLLKCEFMKTRRRYIFLTAIVITVAELLWVLYGKYNGFVKENGWMMSLYQLPLVNSIFMPIMSIIISSRLADTEHKGMMFKHLAAISDKGRIFDAKFIYGMSIVLICCLLNWIITIIFGYYIGFSGDVPIKLYLLYLLFTITPTISVYIFQHTLAMLFKNQAVTFFSGIIGTFIGLFSMFLPQLPMMRKLFIWGYYGVLQFVGLFGWTKETRYDTAYFEVMSIDWTFFAVPILISIAMYILGRYLFSRKEV